MVFWIVYTVIVALTWHNSGRGFGRDIFHGILWLPARIICCYPFIFWVLPQLAIGKEPGIGICQLQIKI